MWNARVKTNYAENTLCLYFRPRNFSSAGTSTGLTLANEVPKQT